MNATPIRQKVSARVCASNGVWVWSGFVWLLCFNGVSVFVGNLMPKPSL